MTAQLKTEHWRQRRLGRWKWVAGIALLLGIVLMVMRDVPFVDWLEGIAQPMRDLGWVGVLVYAGIFIAAGLLCLPCLPITLTSGYIFGMAGGVLAVLAVRRWQHVQAAMRQGAELPTSRMPAFLGAVIVVITLAVIVVVLIQP